MEGSLVYVMGPSGAGKDSVLSRARALLPPEAPVVFAHRYITRPADTGGENHVAVTRAEFAMRRAHGLFAYHWGAHGNDYGVGREIHDWRAAGLTVVVSGSRDHFLRTGGLDSQARPVLITAPADRLKQRLAGRGRENAAEAAKRLERAEAYEIADPRLVTIVNDGTLDKAAEAFVRLLADLSGQAPPSAEPETCQNGERPVGRRLAEDTEVAHRQRLIDEGGEAVLKLGEDRRAFPRVLDMAGERKMEAPLLHYIGIAPAPQQLVLPGAQARRPPTGQFGPPRPAGEGIELDDAAVGEILKDGTSLRRYEGEEITQLDQREQRDIDLAFRRGEGTDRIEQVAFGDVVGQRHRRLQGAVEAVQPRIRDQFGQPLTGNAPDRGDVPRLARVRAATEPAAGGDRQRLFRARRVVERVAGPLRCIVHAFAQAVAPARRPIMARRSLLENQSMTETVTRIIRMTKATLLPLRLGDLVRKVETDATRAHDTDDGGRARVAFKIVEDLAQQYGQNLW